MESHRDIVRRRVRRTRGQWAALIAAQWASGQTIAAFCREHDVPTNSFHRWRRRLKDSTDASTTQPPQPPEPPESPEPSFVRLRVEGGDASSSVSPVVVRFVDGVQLRVGGERLGELVALLRRGSIDSERV